MSAKFKKFAFWGLATLTCLLVILSWSLTQHLPQSVSTLGTPETVMGDRPIEAIPNSPDLDPDKVALGKQLFAETKLSKDNSVSCLSCHSLSHGGADKLAVSRGINGQLGQN